MKNRLRGTIEAGAGSEWTYVMQSNEIIFDFYTVLSHVRSLASASLFMQSRDFSNPTCCIVEASYVPPYLLRDGIEAIDIDPSPEQAFIEDDAECDPERRNEEVDCLTEQ